MCCLQVSVCVAIIVHRVIQSMECFALCVLHSETQFVEDDQGRNVSL